MADYAAAGFVLFIHDSEACTISFKLKQEWYYYLQFTGIICRLEKENSLSFFSCSLSSHPDQPSEQRRFPVHLSRKSVC